MIVANLQEIGKQVALTDAMRKGLAFLRENEGKVLEDGRIVIDGDRVFALVQSYDSKANPEVMFEGHRRYIDLQYVSKGEEAIGWAPLEAAAIVRPYNDERDMWLGTVPAEQATFVYLKAGQLAVLYPSDAHAPQRAAGGVSSHVNKIVVKVAVE